MTNAEKTARQMIVNQTTEKLLDQWELTTNMTGENVPMMRGWYMDELEKRNPEAYDKWLDSENADDKDLRKYMLQEA